MEAENGRGSAVILRKIDLIHTLKIIGLGIAQHWFLIEL